MTMPMIVAIFWLVKNLIVVSCCLTKKAEPPPTRDVNRDSGTDSANGGWFRRLVRPHGINLHPALTCSEPACCQNIQWFQYRSQACSNLLCALCSSQSRYWVEQTNQIYLSE